MAAGSPYPHGAQGTRHRRALLAGIVVVLSMAIAACGPSDDAPLDQSTVVEYVHRDASGYVELDRRAGEDAGGTPAAQRDWLVDAAQRATPLRDAGLEYERDVEPWLGDAVALATFGRDLEQLRHVLVLHAADPDEARATLEEAGTRQSSDRHGDVEVVAAESLTGSGFAWAVDGDVVLLARTADLVLTALDARSDEAHLAREPQVEDALSALPGQPQLRGWASPPLARALLARALRRTISGFAAQGALGNEAIQAIDAVAVGALPERDGLRSHLVVQYDRDELGTYDLGGETAPSVLRSLPAATSCAVSSANLGGRIAEAVGALGPEHQRDLERAQQFSGVTIDEIAELTSGRYAIMSLPLQVAGEFAYGVVIENRDQARMDRTMRSIIALAGLALDVQTPRTEIGDATAYQITVDEVRLLAASYPDVGVIGTDPGLLSAIGGDGPTLGDHPPFERARDLAGAPDEIGAGVWCDAPTAGRVLAAASGGSLTTAPIDDQLLGWTRRSGSSHVLELFAPYDER